MSPSYHHAYIGAKLIAAFSRLDRYSVFAERTRRGVWITLTELMS